MKEDLVVRLLEMLLDGDKKNNDVEKKSDHPMIGQYVIIRTYSAGVHIGYLDSVDGCEVIISKCRMIFYWNGAFTLRELSLNGVSEGSKITAEVPLNSLTKIEIIPVSKECEKMLRDYPSYEI